jgi:hypothetical protein
MKFLRTVLAFSLAAVVTPVFAQQTSTTSTSPSKMTSSDMEIMREKVKADKKLLVAQNMNLTEAEGKAFWPIYDAYQKDLGDINARLEKTVKAYADAYNKGPLSDETARSLANEYIGVEESEVALKKSYLPKLEKAIGAAKGARYLQIETKIRAAVKYELADGIPLAK